MDMQTELQGVILRVTMTSTVDLNSSVRLMNLAFDLAAEKRVFKVLFNALALAGKLSTFERYELGSKVTEHLARLGTNPKVAFVGVPPAVNRFGVRVAQNRGTTVELLHRIPEAVAWLGKWPHPEEAGRAPI
jgi:hypothetical protein